MGQPFFELVKIVTGAILDKKLMPSGTTSKKEVKELRHFLATYHNASRAGK